MSRAMRLCAFLALGNTVVGLVALVGAEPTRAWVALICATVAGVGLAIVDAIETTGPRRRVRILNGPDALEELHRPPRPPRDRGVSGG